MDRCFSKQRSSKWYGIEIKYDINNDVDDDKIIDNNLNDDHCYLELITPIKSWKNDKYASKYVIGGDENDPQPCNLQSFNLNLFLLLTILLTFFILNVLVR